MVLQHKYFPLQIILLPLLAIVVFAGCTNDHQRRAIEPAFYYWKSVFNLNDLEKQKLDSLKVRTIYLKFFDVDWNELHKTPEPVGKLKMTGNPDNLPDSIQIIPTVFIANACIQKIDSADVEILASQVFELIKYITGANEWLARHSSASNEIQLDCDWTASTREKYFHLINSLKSKAPGLKLSCTIRLHQVKYVKKTGVPPVDRGLLMCYNMGNLYNPATTNSIIETTELKKYISDLGSYPLSLDVAFPLFDWKVLYRNNKYSGLFQNLPADFFNISFATKKGNRYFIVKDTTLQGYELRKGDMIRDEQSDIKEVKSAAAEISKHLRNTHPRVSLYHLDSVILSKYTTHELENIYNSLH